MRPLYLLCVVGILVAHSAFAQSAAPADDTAQIRQLEADLLTAERTTDPKTFDRILAADYVNLTPTGVGPGKDAILANLDEHKGEAPPYSAHQQELHVYLVDSTTAVAVYVKEYVAKENKNVAHHDTTDVFVRGGETWHLKLTRTSPHAENNAP
jgi:hypothetical protein